MKLDSKIRFQKQSFRQKLDQARAYKRSTKQIPQKTWAVFLSKIGLSSWRNRIILLLVIIIALAIIYIPNFFYIKHISVAGLDSAATEQVLQEIQTYQTKNFLWPQKNILLLSKNNLSNYLLNNDRKILKINKITKHFPNSLEVVLEPRLNRYILQTPTGNYILTNDGVIVATVDTTAFLSTTSPYSNLLNIEITGETQMLSLGVSYLNSSLIVFINELLRHSQEIFKSTIKKIEMDKPDSPDITIYLVADYQVKFDTQTDLSTIWPKLSLLLTDISDQDQKRLYYIDMRIPNRAYVCYKGTACTQSDRSPNSSTTSSSTLNSILNP